ncbi:hypothetical protein GCK72_016737 [Caenorhabditis remanei]|uniref:Serpentine Receptor, class H n=1 Tax=Caenorhabditis remanei TaxID=31234 RepID=A0A6A5G5F6_CAERE|nr:hypothetical protein GCK72_016737 [Caenorhabditis remanei]KAF1750190.1 hypothetical protein GCK72_016737 [Caenorhabditis remanei]
MNCYESAPEPYASLMRYPHILSIILYSLAFRALCKKQNENFHSFSRLLLWHTIGSFVSQMYFSFLALPVSYLPYPVYRSAGVFMYLDVPGVLVMNLELILITHSALSTIELLRFRLEAARPDRSKFDPIKVLVYLFRLNLIVIFLYLTSSTPHAIEKQKEYKFQFSQAYPSLPVSNLIQCPNVFIFPPITDNQYMTSLVSMCSVTTTTLFLVVISVITIPFRIRALKKTASKKTIEVQKMFFVSVFLQAIINSLFFIFPVSEFLKFAIGNELTDGGHFQLVLILMPYHGTAATIIMICFTRPIRDSITGTFTTGKVASAKSISRTMA